ncbi:hypothetical protein BpHYR1_010677 [Brachionus plicatilis]|uniref:Uncharacterized protein n=1 Tax=Brachionus plicatilis TaxID=10195 RepID=A0A3M7PWK0_BRAPC|nr:hypothetical protein BpHYR1_010677 [Brachionus plicatilis]
MFDVFHALGTLPSRRDKLKSSIISINEFLVQINYSIIVNNICTISKYLIAVFIDRRKIKANTRKKNGYSKS